MLNDRRSRSNLPAVSSCPRRLSHYSVDLFRKLVTANVGTNDGVLALTTGKILPLTCVHTAGDPRERMRIEGANGWVMKVRTFDEVYLTRLRC